MEIEYHYLAYGDMGNLEAAHPSLFRLAPTDQHYPSWFRLLRTCPDISDKFPCYFYLQSSDRLVASLSALPDELSMEGHTLPWAWGGSFLTSPECRGQGLGSKLWGAAMQTLHENGFTIAGAFANPVTTHICKGMGFTIMGRVPRLLLLKTARPFLAYHMPGKLLVQLLDAPYRLLAKGIRVCTSIGKHGDVQVTLERLADLDDLKTRQGEAKPCYDLPYHFNDGIDKFGWKLPLCRGSEIYLISDRFSGDVMVRFVLKTREVTTKFDEKYSGFRLMTLMDYVLFRDPETSYEVLADAVVRLFWKSDAEVLETVSSSPALNACLRRKLMLAGGRGVAFWYKTPPGLKMPPSAAVITNWHFTHFSTDAFCFG